MGRWKDDGKGNPYYDSNDSGPNQLAVPTGYNADGSKQQPAAPAQNQTPTDYSPSWQTAATPPPAPAAAGQVGQYMPQGYDQTKWNDTTHDTPKYAIGRILSKYPPTPEGLQAAKAEIEASGLGTVTGKDAITLQGGEYGGHVIDVGKSFSDPGNNSAWQWLDTTADRQAGAAGPLGGSSGSMGVSAGGLNGLQQALLSRLGISGSGPNIAGNLAGGATGFWDTLSQRAGQNIIPNANDPIIARQVDAFSAQQDRNARNYMGDLAESSGPGANLRTEGRIASEKAGQATGSLQSQLMQNELQARRQEVEQALQLQAGLLTADQQMALQQQLGLINAALAQQGQVNQNNQFLDSLGLQSTDRANYWDALRSGLING